MPRSARPILRLLALLLFLQWGGWSSPHAGIGAMAGELVVICSPEGPRELRLGPDGQPAEPSSAPPGCCLMCPGPLAGAGLVPSPALPRPRVVAAPDVAMAETVRRLSFSPPPATHRSRAPPVA